jgi:hypothetical protein
MDWLLGQDSNLEPFGEPQRNGVSTCFNLGLASSASNSIQTRAESCRNCSRTIVRDWFPLSFRSR